MNLVMAVVVALTVCTNPTTLTQTAQAIAFVESRFDPNAVGDNGEAIGVFQIHPIMVDDVNIILGGTPYTLDDRWSVVKSSEVFAIYCLHYWPKGTSEDWARGWNGGPSWREKKWKTNRYWKTVKERLNEVCYNKAGK